MPKIIILSEEDCAYVAKILKLMPFVTKPGLRQLIELFEKAPSEHTIRIVVEGGIVQDVENMPMGLYYEVQDFDNCSECGGLDPECEWCEGGRIC